MEEILSDVLGREKNWTGMETLNLGGFRAVSIPSIAHTLKTLTAVKELTSVAQALGVLSFIAVQR